MYFSSFSSLNTPCSTLSVETLETMLWAMSKETLTGTRSYLYWVMWMELVANYKKATRYKSSKTSLKRTWTTVSSSVQSCPSFCVSTWLTFLTLSLSLVKLNSLLAGWLGSADSSSVSYNFQWHASMPITGLSWEFGKNPSDKVETLPKPLMIGLMRKVQLVPQTKFHWCGEKSRDGDRWLL